MTLRSKWCLIGIPDHQAVIAVGGRIGAAKGPEAFRTVFRKFKGRDGILEQMQDGGDVAGIGTLTQANHDAATLAVKTASESFAQTVIVGGSHDHGYSHLSGIKKAFPSRRIGCINLDAHLDVRKPEPEITSGSPFYLAIESGVLDPKRFVEFGIQPQCNAAPLWDYVKKKKVRVRGIEELRDGKAFPEFKKELAKLSKICDLIVVSFDLDVVSQAFAPGVSAPVAEGFNPTEVFQMMEWAGKNKKVISLGIFELNPEYDTDLKTARLAATLAYRYLSKRA